MNGNPILLIADGDAELRDIYRRFFVKHEFEVETSPDALDCLEKVRQLKPALLVLDKELRWGGSDGVLALLRGESLTLGLPVILTDTADRDWSFAEFIRPPVVDQMAKPFILADLLKSIRSAIAKRGKSEPSCPDRVPGNPEPRAE
ncbi:MAG: response regulator [Isosphaeraceae bacterium]